MFRVHELVCDWYFGGQRESFHGIPTLFDRLNPFAAWKTQPFPWFQIGRRVWLPLFERYFQKSIMAINVHIICMGMLRQTMARWPRTCFGVLFMLTPTTNKWQCNVFPVLYLFFKLDCEYLSNFVNYCANFVFYVQFNEYFLRCFPFKFSSYVNLVEV